jgi:mono/diheme cytochrome c family protein
VNRTILFAVLAVLALGALAVLAAPFAVAHTMRTQPKRQPRLHPVLDMDKQARYRGQAPAPAFADGRAKRPPVPGTVAWSPLPPDEAFEQGTAGEAWIEDYPPAVVVDARLLARGAERFAISCAPCHGTNGAGDGPVSQAALRRAEAAWVVPTSLTAPEVVERPNGHLFQSITHGIRSMPAHGSQIPPADRWAIIAHVRALQATHSASSASGE